MYLVVILKGLICKKLDSLHIILDIFYSPSGRVTGMRHKCWKCHAFTTGQVTYTTVHFFVIEELNQNRRTKRKRNLCVCNVGVMIQFPGR